MSKFSYGDLVVLCAGKEFYLGCKGYLVGHDDMWSPTRYSAVLTHTKDGKPLQDKKIIVHQLPETWLVREDK